MLSNLLSNSMKHGALDRFSPDSARRFYNSAWETFRAETHKTNGRRLFRARPVLDTGASGSSMKWSRRGQMRQVRQMRGRFKIANLPRPQSWTASRSALSAALAAGAAGFSKTFPPAKVADSPNLIQTNSTTDIPLTPIHSHRVQQSKDPAPTSITLSQSVSERLQSARHSQFQAGNDAGLLQRTGYARR